MENFNVEVNDKTYKMNNFNLVDVYDKVDQFRSSDVEKFRDIMVSWHAGSCTCANSYVNCKHGFEACTGLVSNVEWICNKGFGEEVKPTRLVNYSYILDKKLQKVVIEDVFGYEREEYPIVEIKDTVKIPIFLLNNGYLDCELEYNGETYYTMRNFIKSC